jgi:hypothetical protein
VAFAWQHGLWKTMLQNVANSIDTGNCQINWAVFHITTESGGVWLFDQNAQTHQSSAHPKKMDFFSRL